jgi:hypothetical protein
MDSAIYWGFLIFMTFVISILVVGIIEFGRPPKSGGEDFPDLPRRW